MTNTWRQYFVAWMPESLQLRTKEDLKAEVELILCSIVNQKNHGPAMAVLRHMLPEKIWIIAENPRIAKNFADAVRKQWIYIGSLQAIRGIDGVCVVRVGAYECFGRHGELIEIEDYLRTRRNTNWVIREWCHE